MESQCVGLTEALGLMPVVKRVRLRSPWRQLTPYLRLGGRVQFTADSDSLTPPWPDLLIATGRHSVAASILVRKLSGGKTRNVQLQNPVIAARHFDLVVVPRHDELHWDNIISTRGALHRITPELLRKGADRLRPEIARLPGPYVSVLIGGSNGAYHLGPDEMMNLARQPLAVAPQLQAGPLGPP